jgi:hypothetical protein
MCPKIEQKSIIVFELTCTRCGASWWPTIRSGAVVTPKTCVACRSPYWDKPKTRFFKQKEDKK